MIITKEIDGKNATLKLEGRLDTITSSDLEKAAEELDSSIEVVTLNMEKLEYISSSGLRVLLALHKKLVAPKKLVVKNIKDTVKDVLEITGFLSILNIEN